MSGQHVADMSATFLTKPNNDAAAPVYAVNKNVVSLLMTPTAKQKS